VQAILAGEEGVLGLSTQRRGHANHIIIEQICKSITIYRQLKFQVKGL